MSQGPNRVLDEFAKLMTDAAGVAQSVRREAESVFRTQIERLTSEMDLVRREDFDIVREMASKARAETEALHARISELEARLASLEKGGGAKTTARSKKQVGS